MPAKAGQEENYNADPPLKEIQFDPPALYRWSSIYNIGVVTVQSPNGTENKEKRDFGPWFPLTVAASPPSRGPNVSTWQQTPISDGHSGLGSCDPLPRPGKPSARILLVALLFFFQRLNISSFFCCVGTKTGCHIPGVALGEALVGNPD